MTKFPSISGKKLIKILERYNFRFVRRKGSHVVVKHTFFGTFTVIPVHGNEDLGRGILRSILADLEIEQDDFFLMLKNKKDQTGVEMLRLDRYVLH